MRPGARTDVGPPLRCLTSGPRLGFGAWAVGGTGWGAPSAESDHLAAVRRALELGITFFDTAPTYGDGASESLLGRALKADRDRVAIATKVGPRDDPRRGPPERKVRRPRPPGVPGSGPPTQDLLVQGEGVRASAGGGRAARGDRTATRHPAVGARARVGPGTARGKHRPGRSTDERAGRTEPRGDRTPSAEHPFGDRRHRGRSVSANPCHE